MDGFAISSNKPKGLKAANSDQMADRHMLGHNDGLA